MQILQRKNGKKSLSEESDLVLLDRIYEYNTFRNNFVPLTIGLTLLFGWLMYYFSKGLFITWIAGLILLLIITIDSTKCEKTIKKELKNRGLI